MSGLRTVSAYSAEWTAYTEWTAYSAEWTAYSAEWAAYSKCIQ